MPTSTETVKAAFEDKTTLKRNRIQETQDIQPWYIYS